MANANDVKEMSDDELAAAVDRLPFTIIDESHPVIAEWVNRRRAQRQPEKLGQRVSRAEALRISRQILKDAERGRIEAAEQEARKGPTYWDGEPTEPAAIRALSEVLTAWKQRQWNMGNERNRDELSWLNRLDARLDVIKKDFFDNKYACVADMAAACLAWLSTLAPDDDEATPQSEDE